jgi:hypothetical protein
MTEEALDQTLAGGEGQHHQEDEDGRQPTQGPQYLFSVRDITLCIAHIMGCSGSFTTFCVYEFLSKKLRKLGNFFYGASISSMYRCLVEDHICNQCCGSGIVLSRIRMLFHPGSQIQIEDGKN